MVHVYRELGDVLHTVIYLGGQTGLLVDPLAYARVHQYLENLDFSDSCGILRRP